jgi:phosphoglycerate dehydrogenase-like enzyme
MTKYTVVIYAEDEGFYKYLVDLHLPNLSVKLAASEAEAKKLIPEADILLANPGLIKRHLADAKKLQWVQTVTVGIDALLGSDLRRDYKLTNARGILGPKLTEYAFGHILAYKKRILELYDLQRRHEWDSRSTASLQGETMAVLGTGSIGSHIAMVAKTFGMKTVGYRTKKESVPHFDEIFGSDELSLAIKGADYVISVLPATKETEQIIDKETISHMKDGALFMNIGRGSAVNEEDLLHAIQTKKLSRAILDVFNVEPLQTESPLWDEPNIIVTPHMAGFADPRSVAALFAENYDLFCEGKKLKYQVDFNKGY